MVKYRLKFRFDSFNTVEQREDNINSILSDLTDIVSDTPIRKLEVNEIVEVNGIRYKVKEVVISLEVSGDITYYDFNTILSNEKSKLTQDDNYNQWILDALSSDLN